LIAAILQTFYLIRDTNNVKVINVIRVIAIES